MYDNLLNSQLDWLSKQILDNGAFVMNYSPTITNRIVPYFSNIAAISLLFDKKYYSKVNKYILWYLSKINLPDKYGIYGTIYDYNLDGNNLISIKDYDSYDSYPATFFSLCKNYYEKTNDNLLFYKNRCIFDLIIDSLITSMDNDYLTWAKPNYKIKYLMDNCEVYQGLIDCSYIYENIFKDKFMANKLKSIAQNNYSSIQNKLFDKNNIKYYYQIDSFGKKYSPNFNNWYPDATSQLFPILYNVIDCNSQLAINLYDNFNQNQTNWYNKKSDGNFPNTYVGYVACLMNDNDKVKKFINYCKNEYIDNNNNWPWNCFECSYLIKTLIKMQKPL